MSNVIKELREVLEPLITEKSDEAYKGYLIKYNLFQDMFYVSKGGSHITSAKTLEKAKKEIDLIT
ncbi:MAG: hypothetical protein ACTSRU_19180 [Candidatus Hodarchaeales archaeon]